MSPAFRVADLLPDGGGEANPDLLGEICQDAKGRWMHRCRGSGSRWEYFCDESDGDAAQVAAAILKAAQ